LFIIALRKNVRTQSDVRRAAIQAAKRPQANGVEGRRRFLDFVKLKYQLLISVYHKFFPELFGALGRFCRGSDPGRGRP
jgi:hypothetical protein